MPDLTDDTDRSVTSANGREVKTSGGSSTNNKWKPPFTAGVMDLRNNILAAVLAPFAEGDVLDVGCYDGHLLWSVREYQKKNGSEAKMKSLRGIDPNAPEATAFPIQYYDGLTIPFEDKKFDTVFCNFVLHHANDQDKVLQELKRVGKYAVILEDRVDFFLSRWATIRMHNFFKLIFPYMAFNPEGFHTTEKWCNLLETTGFHVLHHQFVPSCIVFAPFLCHTVFVLSCDDENSEDNSKVASTSREMDFAPQISIWLNPISILNTLWLATLLAIFIGLIVLLIS